MATRLEIELENLIQAELQTLCEQVLHGNAQDYTEYKSMCAKIEAYKKVVDEFFDEAREAINKE